MRSPEEEREQEQHHDRQTDKTGRSATEREREGGREGACMHAGGVVVFTLTAAVCSLKRCTGEDECRFQMKSLLSLPPEASWLSSKDQRSPHTSCLWPCSLLTYGSRTRTSRSRIRRSRLPEASTCAFHDMVPMRAEWPGMVRILRHRLVSQICTSP